MTNKLAYERQIYGIESTICIRCKNEEEGWKYIWECKTNHMTKKAPWIM